MTLECVPAEEVNGRCCVSCCFQSHRKEPFISRASWKWLGTLFQAPPPPPVGLDSRLLPYQWLLGRQMGLLRRGFKFSDLYTVRTLQQVIETCGYFFFLSSNLRQTNWGSCSGSRFSPFCRKESWPVHLQSPHPFVHFWNNLWTACSIPSHAAV